MGRRHLDALLLFVFAAHTGTFAYVFPPDLINHEPLPETTTFGAPSEDIPLSALEATTTFSQEPLCDPDGVYTKKDPVYCDRFVSCSYGQANPQECPDGYGFVPFRGCQLLHQMDCGSRTQLQPPKGSGTCPRLDGIYPGQHICNSYIRCTNGNAVTETCAGQTIFDDKNKVCRNPSFEEYSACFLHPKDKPLTNQQVPTNSFNNQQIPPTTYTPFINLQIPTNDDSLNNQQILPTTYKPFANQPVAINHNSFNNQQIPFGNQPVPTNYNSFNQQIPSTPYEPFGNQYVLTTYPNQQLPNENWSKPTHNKPLSTSQTFAQFGQYETQQTASVQTTSKFVCPATNILIFGDHNRYQYPGNCHLFYMCLRDGSVKIGGCQAPMAYNPNRQVCEETQTVSSCSSNFRR